MTAYRHGIIEPDEKKMFYPDTPITRQDIVYYSSRAMKAAGLSLEQPPLYILYEFNDYRDIAPYAQSAFAAMKYAGIINRIGNNKLGPSAPQPERKRQQLQDASGMTATVLLQQITGR